MEARMFVIVNVRTQKPLRLSYDMETFGQAYMTYERPSFSVEDEDAYNSETVVFTASSRQNAEAVLKNEGSRKGSLHQPALIQGYFDGEKETYMVVEVA